MELSAMFFNIIEFIIMRNVLVDLSWITCLPKIMDGYIAEFLQAKHLFVLI